MSIVARSEVEEERKRTENVVSALPTTRTPLSTHHRDLLQNVSLEDRNVAHEQRHGSGNTDTPHGEGSAECG